MLGRSILQPSWLRDLAARRDGMEAGASAYAHVIAEDGLAPVVEEARRAFESADERKLTEFELDVDGQELRSPMRIASAPAEARLDALHRHPEVIATATSLAGRPMEPTESGYLYYRSGDFIGLHRDLPSCQFTLLAPLFGEAPPLVVYPELMDSAPESLLRLARASNGAPPGGRAVEIPARGLVALSGIRAPHQTPDTGGARPACLATLCYRERA